MSWITVSVWVVGAVLCGVYGIRDLSRTFTIKRFAKKSGFTYLRQRLPEALSLYGTPFAHRGFTWNVIDNQHDLLRVVVFDCQMDAGKEVWRRTVIAVRTGSRGFDVAKFPRMQADNSGGWTILYYPRSMKAALTPVKELQAHLKLL